MSVYTYDNGNIFFALLEPASLNIEVAKLGVEEGIALLDSEFNKNNKMNYTLDYSRFKGLSLKVIFQQNNLKKLNTLVVAAYTSLPYKGNTTIFNQPIFIDRYLINKDDYSETCRIDDVVASIIISEYSSSTPARQLAGKCFLQRYHFETAEKTDKALEQYLGIKRPEEHEGLEQLIKVKVKNTDN